MHKCRWIIEAVYGRIRVSIPFCAFNLLKYSCKHLSCDGLITASLFCWKIDGLLICTVLPWAHANIELFCCCNTFFTKYYTFIFPYFRTNHNTCFFINVEIWLLFFVFFCFTCVFLLVKYHLVHDPPSPVSCVVWTKNGKKIPDHKTSNQVAQTAEWLCDSQRCVVWCGIRHTFT